MGGHSTDLDYLENIVLLHDACHTWLHSHSQIAREHGWIVSKFGTPPEDVPLLPIPASPV